MCWFVQFQPFFHPGSQRVLDYWLVKKHLHRWTDKIFCKWIVNEIISCNPNSDFNDKELAVLWKVSVIPFWLGQLINHSHILFLISICYAYKKEKKKTWLLHKKAESHQWHNMLICETKNWKFLRYYTSLTLQISWLPHKRKTQQTQQIISEIQA